MAPTGAQPDRAQTSNIGALAGCAICLGLAVCQCIPAVVAPSRRLIARALFPGAALLRRGLILFGFDELQHGAEALVLLNGGMGDALILVESRVGELDPLPAELQPPVREFEAVNVFARQPAGHFVLFEDDPLPVVGEGQLTADIALIAESKDIPQPVRLGVQGPVQIVRAGWRLGELSLVPFHETGKERIGSLYVRDAGQPQPLHQPVLQCAVGAFHATLRLA